jgi:hypothetical protein
MSFSHGYAHLFLAAYVVLLPVALAAGCPICHTARQVGLLILVPPQN